MTKFDPDKPDTYPGSMKPGEVAAVFDVTTKTIQRWTNEGRLVALPNDKPGGHRRFSGAYIAATRARTLDGAAPAQPQETPA